MPMAVEVTYIYDAQLSVKGFAELKSSNSYENLPIQTKMEFCQGE